MKIEEILKQLEKIHQERLLEAHHDSYDLHQPDLDTLDCVINLLKLLDEQKLTDSVIIGELLLASGIKK